MKKTIALFVLLAGCSQPRPAEAPPAPATHAPPATPADPLAAFDSRAPLPLLAPMAAHQREQMRGHLAAVHDVVAAVARDDLGAAAVAGDRLGTSDSMMEMCSHMGAGAPGFTERALAFHRTGGSRRRPSRHPASAGRVPRALHLVPRVVPAGGRRPGSLRPRRRVGVRAVAAIVLDEGEIVDRSSS